MTMTIGVLTTSYPRHDGDYAGCFVADRVQRLLAAGHTVDVLAAGDAAAAIGAPARDGKLSVTRVAAEPALFYGSGAPEALERGGVAAWLAAARFSTALAVAARARCAAWDEIEAHWLVPCALAAQAAAPAHATRAYVHSGDVALLERMPLGRAIARRLARGLPLRQRRAAGAVRVARRRRRRHWRGRAARTARVAGLGTRAARRSDAATAARPSPSDGAGGRAPGPDQGSRSIAARDRPLRARPR
jgi:hypothetical protein